MSATGDGPDGRARGTARDGGDRRAPPDVVAGRYEILEALGSGGASRVHAARDRVTGGRVAVKLLDAGVASASLRVHREISALRLLRLPGVVALLDEGKHGDARFLVMELVAGRAFPGSPTPAPWERIAPLALSILEILARVHAAGVVHRDLKPSNVLVDDEGRLTVLDFGISWGPALGEVVTTAGAIVGTPEYLAPEQFVGAAADARTDLYAVGVMLYDALSGQHPHRASEFSELVALKRSQMPVPLRIAAPTVPRDVAQVVDQLLAMDPENRPQSAGETLEALFGMRPRGASFRTLLRLGGDAAVRRVVDTAAAGRSLDVSGPPGSGRSRLLVEAADRLSERGLPVVWIVPGSAPYSSLASLVGNFDELRDASHADALPAIRRRVEAALRAGSILFVDDSERVDRWSAAVLEPCRETGAIVRVTATPSGDALVLGDLSEEDLRGLFRGPDRVFHLREDGAHELWRRTVGHPARIAAELSAWVRAGLAHWEGDLIVVRRDALDRLRGGLPVGDELLLHPGPGGAGSPHLDDLLAWVVLAWPNATLNLLARATSEPRWSVEPSLQALEDQGFVRRLPDGSVQPLVVPRALHTWSAEKRRRVHSTLASVLPPGAPQRLRHLAASAPPEEVAEEALLVAAELARVGRLADAMVVLEVGHSAARGCSDVVLLETRILVEVAKACLTQGTAAAFDRALYELSRAGHASAEIQRVERLLRAARSVGTGDAEGILAELADIGPFDDLDLELWRHGYRMAAARWVPVERAGVVLEQIAGWARRSGHPRALASAASWRALHLIALGRRRDAAPLHLEAAERTQRVAAKMAGWLNAAIAYHGCGRTDESEAAARKMLDLAAKCRHPLYEAHAESLLRAIRYQRGQPDGPDLELIEAAESLGNPTVLGALYLTEGAFAWRRGDSDSARRLALRATRVWSGAGDAEIHAMSQAFALVCGEPSTDGEIARLAASVRDIADLRLVVETLGLLALAAPPGLAAALRREAASIAPRVEHPDPDVRMDVLTLREALDGLVTVNSNTPH